MTNDKEDQLAYFFHRAKTQNPKLSFEDASSRFSSSLMKGGNANLKESLLEKWFGKLLGFSTLVATVLGAALLFNIDSPSKTIAEVPVIENEVNNPEVVDEIAERLVQTTPTKKQSETIPPTKQSVKKQTQASEIPQQIEKAIPKDSSDQTETSLNLSNEVPTPSTIKEKESAVSIDPPQKLTAASNVPQKRPDSIKVEPTEIRFTLTEYSTETDFSQLKKEAKAVGVDLHYQVHHQKKKKTKDLFLVRDFKIEMQIPETDLRSQIEVIVPKGGSFEVSLGWSVDQTGRAIALSKSLSVDKTQ